MDKHDGDVPAGLLRTSLQANRELLAALNRAWPVIDPADLVSDLWSVPAYLRLCAPWLRPGEVRRLQRPDAQAYRTPQEVMTEAEPVIRAVLPDANVPASIRSTGVPVRHGPVSDLGPILGTWLATHADGTAALMGDPTFPAAPRVRSLTPELAKGLEFDLVILINPETFGTGRSSRPLRRDDSGDPAARHPHQPLIGVAIARGSRPIHMRCARATMSGASHAPPAASGRLGAGVALVLDDGNCIALGER